MNALGNATDVRDNTEDRRFEIWVDGELAGFTTYVVTSGVIWFLYTELDPRLQGRGLGEEVAAALRSARERGLKDLVPEQDRAHFEL